MLGPAEVGVARGRDPVLPAYDRNLRPIPSGWQAIPLREVTSVLRRGISPKYTDVQGVAVLNQKCVRNNRDSLGPARLHDPSKRIGQDQFLRPGDVLVNSTGMGTLGRVGQLMRVDRPMTVDSHVTIVRANADIIDPVLLSQDLLSRQDEIEALGEGSTGQTELSRDSLGRILVVVSPKEMQRVATSRILPLVQAQDACGYESLTLSSIRDTLLPKLLSGAVRVNVAEALMGAAL
jgi:type I restriction enzyme S subunit